MVLGALGMLGTDLVEEFAGRRVDTCALDLGDCDIVDAEACRKTIRSIRPSAVINCAAYTDVNRAESERESAFLLNAEGAENVARACACVHARCVYVSTDYVFDGTSPEAYTEGDAPNPVNVYGASKLEGERRVAAALHDHAIVRTTWLYGIHGRCFPKIVLDLAKRGMPLRIVSDQVGAPTYTRDLARLLADIVTAPAAGIYHATNSGACSWFDFAKEILSGSGIQALDLTPVRTEDYPTPAKRPANSRLADTRLGALGVAPLPPWQDALGRYLAEAASR